MLSDNFFSVCLVQGPPSDCFKFFFTNQQHVSLLVLKLILDKKARFARVRAARGHTQMYCRTPGALPYHPHPLDPLSLPILAVGVHLLYVCST